MAYLQATSRANPPYPRRDIHRKASYPASDTDVNCKGWAAFLLTYIRVSVYDVTVMELREIKVTTRIQQALDSQGLSQRELARRCDIDFSYMNRLVRGKITPTVPTALRIAGVLGVSVEDLFKLEEPAA